MALTRHGNWLRVLTANLVANVEIIERGVRWYGGKKSKEEWNKLRPMIKKRIEKRASFYPLTSLIPVAQQVLQARSQLITGVSALLQLLPVLKCEFCPEVYAGETGHLIRTCCGYKRLAKNQAHRWIRASLDDILVPVETFHLDNRVHDEMKHHERFDFERVPAIVELCYQAGAHSHTLNLQSPNYTLNFRGDTALDGSAALARNDLRDIGNRTLKAWETLREGVEKLLLVYPAKVCKYCSEVHVGSSGHKARLCGVFKYQSWRGTHLWKKAGVDDVVPPKIVWYRRSQDPPALLDEGRSYYGHAPAVVDLCSKAGAVPPAKYFCMMKVQGLTRVSSDNV